jgi:hypothetical protein
MTDATLTASEAATQIVGLINSRVSSPSKDEIEVVLAKISGAPVHSGADAAGAPSTLGQAPLTEHPLVKEANAVVDIWHDACEGAEAAGNDTAVDAAGERVDGFARRLWARQPTSAADIVARAIIFEHWCGGIDDATGELRYLNRAAVVTANRATECDWSAEAHLLDAIRKVLGGRSYPKTGVAPQCSGPDEDWRELTAELRAAMPPLREAIDVLNNMLLNSKDYPAANVRLRECQARFDAARNRIWKLAPTSPECCVVLAEIAQFDAYDWPEPYQQISLTGGDYMDRDPARLALGYLAIAVLRMGGRRHTAHGSGWRPSS